MRITWFGSNCFRVAFGDQQFAFYSDHADEGIANAELTANAVIIDDTQLDPFLPYNGELQRVSTGRLIDEMEVANSYFRLGEMFVLDAPPDERLILIAGNKDPLENLSEEIEGAAVLISACFDDVVQRVADLENSGARQLLLAITDQDKLDMSVFTQKAGKLRLQLLERGFAIEL
ncbi:hypothetical protein [Maritalea sp.]|uniref:hypothetical protein n=1 Tax=Maritalea sp. TaxID=2003361 RepID=UPI003EF96480